MDPNTVYAGLAIDGAYKTTDGGNTWKRVKSATVAIGAIDYYSIVRIDPFNSDIVYISGFTSYSGSIIPCTIEHCVSINGVLPLGPYKSFDGGQSWSMINLPESFTLFTDLEIDPVNSNIIYGSTMSYMPPLWPLPVDNKGIFKSTDGGNSWEAINNAIDVELSQFPIYKILIDPISSNNLYAVVGFEGVFKSIDGGNIWRRMTMEGLLSSTFIANLGLASQHLYALTSNGVYILENIPIPITSNKIVFSSNRDGNSQIYIMNTDGTNQTRLTNNLANDTVPSWSPDGSKIVFASDRDGNLEIYVMNADGTNQTRLTNNPASDWDTSWSPDGTKIAFRTDRDSNEEIYVMNADGTNPVNLTNNSSRDGEPQWSPDGTKILFSSWRSGGARMFVMNDDGTNPTTVPNTDVWLSNSRWSPDGNKIAYTAYGDIYVINVDGTNKVNLIPYGQSGYPAYYVGSYSPDGSKIVLYSNQDGKYQIYVMNSDGSNLIRLTNNSMDDLYPFWSPY